MVEHFPQGAPLGRAASSSTSRTATSSCPTARRSRAASSSATRSTSTPCSRPTSSSPAAAGPSSITINNWTTYVNENGEPRFKVIVEGANLFITQQARLRLEEKGVILYKDASANKGGVTSSSLEVLASLALTDEECDELMCVRDGDDPGLPARSTSTRILDFIRDNAGPGVRGHLEGERQAKGIPRAILSDLDQREDQPDQGRRRRIRPVRGQGPRLKKAIECCIPPVLVEKIGVAKILKRVPEAYLKALFASALAGHYVYKYGLEANEINFYEFLQEFRKQ